MFKKIPKGHSEVEDMVAFLGKGTDFRGVLRFEGTIRVDGKLEGEIYTKDTLIVGDSAEIIGNVNVGTIITSGKIHGTITVTKKAHFVAPGTFNGDIIAPILQVDEGFLFNGRSEMKKEGKAAAAVEPVKEAKSA